MPLQRNSFIRRRLKMMQERLRAVEPTEPRRLLFRFLAAELKVSRHKLLLEDELLNLSDEVMDSLDGKILRLARGEPLAYVTGRQDFYGLDFLVTEDVLIPRPDTEVLAECFADYTLKVQKPLRVLDIGVGSGALIVAAAYIVSQFDESASWSFTGTDISPAALATAQLNARRLVPEVAIRFVQADLWPPEKPYDFIFSNPPYISDADFAKLELSVKDYEPALALRGGPDGLAFHRRLLAGLSSYLAPGGRFVFEIAPDQGAAVKALAEEAGFRDAVTGQDYAGRDRYVTARAPLA